MFDALVRACTRCPLHQACTAPVPGSGLESSPVMLVGESPGKDEDASGYPFQGQSGKLLNSLLSSIGFPREAVYTTNVVKCRPSATNSTPKPQHITACSGWLDMEIAAINPQIIVALGATAIRRLLGDSIGTVEHLHGKPHWRGTSVVLPCYHPAAALHDTVQLRHVFDDFRVLKGLLAGRPPEDFLVQDQYPEPDYREVRTVRDLVQLENDICNAGVCAVDVETVDNKLWSIQASIAPGTAWFMGPELIDCFEFDPEVTYLVHNYLYDAQFIHPAKFVDTMTIAYLLGLPQGLKELASRLCGMTMHSYADLVKPGRRTKAISYLEQAVQKTFPDPEPVPETKWDNKSGRITTRYRKPQHISRKIRRILADSIDDLSVDPYERWYNIEAQERHPVESDLGVLQDSTIADIPRDSAVRYACRDADATLRVYQAMQPMIEDMGLSFVLHSIDLPTLPVVLEMMQTGFAIDTQHLGLLSRLYSARMEAVSARAAQSAGMPFNPNSSDQVADVVYGKLGFRPTAKTPTGKISTDDRELKKIDHPVIPDILEYRNILKNKGTFTDALLAKAVEHPVDPDVVGTGGAFTYRLHTTLKTTRTETGRLSSSDPNLQNIPVRSSEGKQIRKGFIASPGYRIIASDFDQQEMKVMAHMSQCRAMIDMFLRGEDIHAKTASMIFGVDIETAKQDRYRYPTKRANFGIIYLITGEGLSADIAEYAYELESGEMPDWTPDDCDKLIKDWYRIFPEVKDFQMEQIAKARRYGYVSDMFGRIRHIPEVLCPIRTIRESGERMACNMPIQSGGAGITKLAMVKLFRTRPQDIRFLMQIHDDIMTETPDTDTLPYRISWVKRTMESVVSLSMPMTVTIKTGHNWGEMKKYEGAS